MTSLNNTDGQNFFIPKIKAFIPAEIKRDYVNETLDFAYAMTFGKDGEHRKYRSGGSHTRKNGEVFCDTFQGKLAEFFVYQKLTSIGVNCPKPDIEKWGLGKWDDEDFSINNNLINVKSMAFFSNLLLLETKDWDETGKYIPNNKYYDYFFVVRIKPELKKEFRNQKMLYSDDISLVRIKSILEKLSFFADIPGYVTNSFLKEKIQAKQILPKGSMLNGRIKMDAENYYILSIDFEEFDNIKQRLI
tara:strand:- start:2094 stop:2831 length:738 start_codon:yes stop_codon:yes gene_type:complete